MLVRYGNYEKLSEEKNFLKPICLEKCKLGNLSGFARNVMGNISNTETVHGSLNGYEKEINMSKYIQHKNDIFLLFCP